MAMTISELAKSAGVGVETVRYYQRRGLLFVPRPSSGGGGRAGRHYGETETRRLAFIRHAQAAGFTLAEIGELLALDAGQDRARVRAMAGSRIAALDAQIAALQDARRALVRLSDKCSRSETGPCPIIEAFER